MALIGCNIQPGTTTLVDGIKTLNSNSTVSSLTSDGLFGIKVFADVENGYEWSDEVFSTTPVSDTLTLHESPMFLNVSYFLQKESYPHLQQQSEDSTYNPEFPVWIIFGSLSDTYTIGEAINDGYLSQRNNDGDYYFNFDIDAEASVVSQTIFILEQFSSYNNITIESGGNNFVGFTFEDISVSEAQQGINEYGTLINKHGIADPHPSWQNANPEFGYLYGVMSNQQVDIPSAYYQFINHDNHSSGDGDNLQGLDSTIWRITGNFPLDQEVIIGKFRVEFNQSDMTTSLGGNKVCGLIGSFSGYYSSFDADSIQIQMYQTDNNQQDGGITTNITSIEKNTYILTPHNQTVEMIEAIEFEIKFKNITNQNFDYAPLLNVAQEDLENDTYWGDALFPDGDISRGYNTSSTITSNACFAKLWSNTVVANINSSAQSRSLFITSVETNFTNSLTTSSDNHIPEQGIKQSNQPIVSVIGSPGAKFSIEFKEIAQYELPSTDFSRSTFPANPSDVQLDGGLIPNMPSGEVTIGPSGVYKFKFPKVDKFVDNGYKEFNMIIDAGSNTLVANSSKGPDGTISSDQLKLTNIFYQYPNVSFSISATIPSSGWSYVTDYAPTDIKTVGKVGTRKSGLALSKLKPAQQIDFDIRVTEASTTFSLISGVTLDNSIFVAGTSNNLDQVRFVNLKATTGNAGASDAFAKLTGTIIFTKYGKQSQEYNVDLTKIFTNS